MKNSLLQVILFFVIVHTNTHVCASQTNSTIRNFDQEQLDKWKNDDDYNYDKIEPPYEQGAFSKAFKAIFDFFSQTIGKMISIIVIIALIVLLFYFISKSEVGFMYNKRDKTTIEATFEEHIEDINYAEKIQQAILTGNHKAAIRFLYLDILKSLSKKGLIKWEVDKTNHEYLREMKNHLFEKDFSKTTFLYEYTWYGDFSITTQTYQQVEPVFKKLRAEINKLG